MYHNGIRGQWHRRRGVVDIVCLVVGKSVGCTHIEGHIVAGLAWEHIVYVPERAIVLLGITSRANYGFIDVARAAVVGGNSQRPVTILCVHIL